jgi:hypothetical protein
LKNGTVKIVSQESREKRMSKWHHSKKRKRISIIIKMKILKSSLTKKNKMMLILSLMRTRR